MKTASPSKLPLNTRNKMRAARFIVPRWKRSLDVTLILITAPVWALVMAAITLLIKLLSRGPVLFKQERIGLGGARFQCLKFRTMHAGAPTASHEEHLRELIQSNRPMQKLDGNDPRLIPVVSLLRPIGLDELPQLFNVLRGEMSLVGPRPCTVQEYAAYSPPQQARLHVLPGLSGLWQVSGKNRTTFSQMIELDLLYVRLSCLWLDLEILRRTPATLLQQVLETIRRRNGKQDLRTKSFEGEIQRTRTTKSGEHVRSNGHRNN